MNWIKIDMDATTNGAHGPGGCGGVFRTHRGIVKGCFDSPLRVLYVCEVELTGVIHTVLHAKQFGYNYFWFECDSSYVVNLLSLLALLMCLGNLRPNGSLLWSILIALLLRP